MVRNQCLSVSGQGGSPFTPLSPPHVQCLRSFPFTKKSFLLPIKFVAFNCFPNNGCIAFDTKMSKNSLTFLFGIRQQVFIS